jgi:hypothetical protein
MSTSLVAFVGTCLVLLALAGWWARSLWSRSANRRNRALRAAERQKADDLRDCRLAHESLSPDRSAAGTEDSPRGPGASGAETSQGRRRAEERWQRAYATASRLDPELPAGREERG